MPAHRVSPDCELHYVVDDYTDPWRKPEAILMMHGNAESGAAWYGWVPQLARHFRIVRPDMRGFGRSTPMPRDFPWTLDRICDDYVSLMDALGVPRFHVIAAKIGGTIARHFAARQSARAAGVNRRAVESRPQQIPGAVNGLWRRPRRRTGSAGLTQTDPDAAGRLYHHPSLVTPFRAQRDPRARA